MLQKTILTAVLFLVGEAYGQSLPTQLNIRPQQNILGRSAPITNALLENESNRNGRFKRPTTASQNTVQNFKIEELIQQPEVFAKLMVQMISSANWQALSLSLPYYAQVKNKNELLYTYSKGLVARFNGQSSESIKTFRSILSNHPEYTAVRVDLASTLMMTEADESATYQFEQSLADKNLQTSTQAYIKNSLAQLAQRQDWSFNAGANYLYDANINNASKKKYVTIFGLPFEKNTDSLPKKASGWQLSADASKQFTLHDQHKLRIGLSLSHKDYNLNEYDEQDFRPDIGYFWSNGLTQAYAGGYFSGKRLDNKLIERTTGLRLAGAHRLSSRWSLNGSYDFSHSNYPTYGILNGRNHAASFGVSYTPKPTVNLFGNVEGAIRDAKDETLSRKEYGARGGVTQDLSNGISYTMSVRYLHDHYSGETPFFGGTRKDREWSPQLTLTWQKLNFKGFIPRLNVVYTNHMSNIPLYEFKKWNTFITIDKKF